MLVRTCLCSLAVVCGNRQIEYSKRCQACKKVQTRHTSSFEASFQEVTVIHCEDRHGAMEHRRDQSRSVELTGVRRRVDQKLKSSSSDKFQRERRFCLGRRVLNNTRRKFSSSGEVAAFYSSLTND